MTEKLVVLTEYLKQLTDSSRHRRKISQYWKKGVIKESVLFTFPYQTNKNHAIELSTVGHVISEYHWKSNFDFTEIVNNYGLKWRSACQIWITFHFSLTLPIQLWKYSPSMVLAKVGRNYYQKNRILEFLAKIFWLSCLNRIKYSSVK